MKGSDTADAADCHSVVQFPAFDGASAACARARAPVCVYVCAYACACVCVHACARAYVGLCVCVQYFVLMRCFTIAWCVVAIVRVQKSANPGLEFRQRVRCMILVICTIEIKFTQQEGAAYIPVCFLRLSGYSAAEAATSDVHVHGDPCCVDFLFLDRPDVAVLHKTGNCPLGHKTTALFFALFFVL